MTPHLQGDIIIAERERLALSSFTTLNYTVERDDRYAKSNEHFI